MLAEREEGVKNDTVNIFQRKQGDQITTNKTERWVWWHMCAIPVLKGPGQENLKFNASMSYTETVGSV